MPLTKNEQNQIYTLLSEQEKWVVDRSLEHARTGDYIEAMMSFVSDFRKIGIDVTPLMFGILSVHAGSYEVFREGILGFFHHKILRE
ncbi:hypothetical protein MAP00_004282 [Monascus purpureus]|nr:hypothetical protein MAP00_004282 [Monascus purpureus]